MPEIELPIITDRLILRRFEAEDLERFHGYQSLPETARYLLRNELTKTKSMEVLGRYANFEFNQEGDWVCLAIERKDHPPGLMGEVVLKWLEGTGQGELGWILHPEARGHGIATEAAEAVMKLAFEKLAFHRIDAKLDALNAGSAGICKRLGMRLEATLWTTGTTKASGPPRTFTRFWTRSGARGTIRGPGKSADGPRLVMFQLFGQLRCRQRTAEVVALAAGAPDAQEVLGLLGGFHASHTAARPQARMSCSTAARRAGCEGSLPRAESSVRSTLTVSTGSWRR